LSDAGPSGARCGISGKGVSFAGDFMDFNDIAWLEQFYL
jgi:hypothetical protein